MVSLREDVEKRIETEMGAIQSARAEALDAMKEVVVAAEVSVYVVVSGLHSDVTFSL